MEVSDGPSQSTTILIWTQRTWNKVIHEVRARGGEAFMIVSVQAVPIAPARIDSPQLLGGRRTHTAPADITDAALSSPLSIPPLHPRLLCTSTPSPEQDAQV